VSRNPKQQGGKHKVQGGERNGLVFASKIIDKTAGPAPKKGVPKKLGEAAEAKKRKEKRQSPQQKTAPRVFLFRRKQGEGKTQLGLTKSIFKQ